MKPPFYVTSKYIAPANKASSFIFLSLEAHDAPDLPLRRAYNSQAAKIAPNVLRHPPEVAD